MYWISLAFIGTPLTAGMGTYGDDWSCNLVQFTRCRARPIIEIFLQPLALWNESKYNVLYSLMAILSFFSHSFQLSLLDVCNQGVYILVQWGKDLWPFLCSPHGCLSFHWENSLYGENRVIVNHAYMLSFLSGFVICFSNDMLIEKQCTIWRIFSRCHCWLLVSMSPLGMQCRNLGVGHKGMKKRELHSTSW